MEDVDEKGTVHFFQKLYIRDEHHHSKNVPWYLTYYDPSISIEKKTKMCICVCCKDLVSL